MSKELRFSSDDAQIEIYKNKGAIVAFTVWEGSKMEPAGFYKKQANDFMDSSLQNVSDIPDHDSVEQITHARLQLFHVNGKQQGDLLVLLADIKRFDIQNLSLDLPQDIRARIERALLLTTPPAQQHWD